MATTRMTAPAESGVSKDIEISLDTGWVSLVESGQWTDLMNMLSLMEAGWIHGFSFLYTYDGWHGYTVALE